MNFQMEKARAVETNAKWQEFYKERWEKIKDEDVSSHNTTPPERVINHTTRQKLLNLIQYAEVKGLAKISIHDVPEKLHEAFREHSPYSPDLMILWKFKQFVETITANE